MKKWLSLSLVLVAAACNDSGGKGNNNPDLLGGGNNNGGNFSVVSRTQTVAPGSDCEFGGTAVQLGLDNGDGGGTARDGALQDGEVDKTQFVCNTAPTMYQTLTVLTPLGLGNEHCMYGGSQVDYGLDNGDGGGTASNNTLEMGEIDGTTYACLPKPADLLVVTTPLYVGDPICPYGGQKVESGFDDGKPAGTAGDQVLQTEEVDLAETRCNPPPTDVFPPVVGSVGSAYIDVTAGGGPGIGSAGRGQGGFIDIEAFGGPLATSVEAHAKGSVTASPAPAAPTLVAGSNPVTVTSALDIVQITVPGDTEPTDTPYVRMDQVNVFGGAPLYYNGKLATSLHITAAGAANFLCNTSDFNLQVQGDIWNEGTITVEGSDSYPKLTIESHHFINQGTVDLRQRTYNNRGLAIYATYGGSGTFYNSGTILTRGFDYTDDSNNPSASGAGPLLVVAADDLVNTKIIEARGGNVAIANGGNSAGAVVELRTMKGNLYHFGTIDVSGGQGDAGASAGSIILANGAESFDEGLLPTVYDPKLYGPGGYSGAGKLLAKGGLAQFPYGNGSGGTVVIRTEGGSINSNTFIDASGGDVVNGDFGQGSPGGAVLIGAFAWVGPNGDQTPVVPNGVFLGPSASPANADEGSIKALSGSNQSGSQYGAQGGHVLILLDVALLGPWDEGAAPRNTSRWFVRKPFDRNQLAALTTQPRIQLSGFAKLVARGSDSPDYERPGDGGVITLRNAICSRDSYLCAFPTIGPRLVFNDTLLDAQAGLSQQYGGAVGGTVNLRLDPVSTQSPAIYQATQLEQLGTIDVSSPDLDTATGSFNGYGGGTVNLNSNAGQINLGGTVKATGNAIWSNNDSGDGGSVYVVGFLVDMTGTINVQGGANPDTPGHGGYLSMKGYQINFSSSALADAQSGGAIEITSATSVVNAGQLLSSGFGYEVDSSRGRNAGYVRINASSVVNNGTIAAKGATVTDNGGYGGDGGTVQIFATSCTQGGTLDASGGNSQSNGSAGGGGNIEVTAKGGSNSATVKAEGGKVVGDTTGYAAGGAGGSLYWASNNSGTLSISGGSAIASTGTIDGGPGGCAYIGGNNSGTVTSTGGAATGASTTRNGGPGGSIGITGTNTGTLSVSGGAGTTAGPNGTVDTMATANFCAR